MDFFTKNRLVFWCVVLLVLLNVATLASFWLRRPPLGPPAGPGGRPAGQRIMEMRLHLTDEQARRFQQLRAEHFLRTRPLQEAMHKIRMDLLDEVFAAEPNDARIQELTAEIGDEQCRFDRQLFRHFRELKDTCNAEQRTELKAMLADLIEVTGPRDPRHRPIGPEGGFRPEELPPPRRQ